MHKKYLRIHSSMIYIWFINNKRNAINKQKFCQQKNQLTHIALNYMRQQIDSQIELLTIENGQHRMDDIYLSSAPGKCLWWTEPFNQRQWTKSL